MCSAVRGWRDTSTELPVNFSTSRAPLNKTAASDRSRATALPVDRRELRSDPFEPGSNAAPWEQPSDELSRLATRCASPDAKASDTGTQEWALPAEQFNSHNGSGGDSSS